MIELQKKRIEKLEQHNRRQARKIEGLKAQLWAKPSLAVVQRSSVAKLKTLVQQKKWVSALKTSSELLEERPKSLPVREVRILVLRKMGLYKEAEAEKKRLLALRESQRRERL